jgi:hypothetical protein
MKKKCVSIKCIIKMVCLCYGISSIIFRQRLPPQPPPLPCFSLVSFMSSATVAVSHLIWVEANHQLNKKVF